MVNRNVIIIVAAAVVSLVVGGIAGAMLFPGGTGGSTGTPTVQPVGTLPPTTQAPTPTPTAASTPTSAPTPTADGGPTPTATPGTPTATPTPTQTRTPRLTRRIDTEEIERELRRLLDDWRRDQGLEALAQSEGSLVADLNRLALNHSVAMAEMDLKIHVSNDLTVAERYKAFDLFRNCRYNKDGKRTVEPDRQFQVLAHTYVGRFTPDGSRYIENETEAAREIFEQFTDEKSYGPGLANTDFNRLGIGIHVTQSNEVWATANACVVAETGP